MKLFPKITSACLAVALMLSIPFSASAAKIDSAQTKAISESSLLAADFEVSGTKLESEITLPSYYSSRDLNYVTPVRNQLYNTCWAYGSLATLESTLLKSSVPVNHFAPMHMNHWGTKRSDETGWQRTYTNGGYSYISLGYLTSWQGPRLESDYPETTPLSEYSYLNPLSKKQFAVNSCVYLDTRDIETVKTAIYNYGAVVGNYHVDDSCFNPITNSYYCDIKGLQTYQLNGHCISIVGWDDNYSRENFVGSRLPAYDGAWLCKNSWDESWGDGGYYWISYEDTYIFDTKFGHSYAFVDTERYTDRKGIFQNEVDGATYQFDYITNKDTLTYVNVFDTHEYKNRISKVNFESEAQGAQYKIFNIPLDTNNVPVRQESRWVEIGSGTVDYCGYISVDTTDFVATGEKFAIGVQLTKQNGSSNSIGVAEWLSTGGAYIYLPSAEYEECYIMSDGNAAVDLMEFYKEACDDEIGGTFVIKAVGEDIVSLSDVDMDGVVSIMDVTDIQRYLAALIDLSDRQLALADTDADGVVSVFDATSIQMVLAGMTKTENSNENFDEF